MSCENSKQQILSATVRLCRESKDICKITARSIAKEAGANLAMINYYFGCKDALLSQAVGEIIASRADELVNIRDRELTPKQKLQEFLIGISDILFDYASLMLPTIPYIILQGELAQPVYILPHIREHFGTAKSETECRVIAYELVVFMQIVFYRMEDFRIYSGLDITDPAQRNTMINTQLNLLVPDIEHPEEL